VFPIVCALLLGLPAVSQASLADHGPSAISATQLKLAALPLPDVAAGPKIMRQFTSNATFEGLGPQAFPATNGTLVYDALGERYVMAAIIEYPAFDHAQLNMTRLASNSTMHMRFNEGCVNFTIPGMAFLTLFEIFSYYGKYNGTSKVMGRPCDMWVINMPGEVQSLCIDGDKPLQLVRDDLKMTLHDFVPEVEESLLAVPECCKFVPAPCGDGEIINQTVYLAHPASLYNISGQDVADSKGDAVFLCRDSYMAKAGHYDLLSAFELSIVRNFSQYTNFPPPGGHGFGGDGFHVGREAPLFTGKHWGQCEDDAYYHHRIGQWFSLPPAGQCIEGRNHIGKDCTWRIERRIATVQMSCLLEDRNFTTKCIGAVAPFLEVEQTLLNTIASEDPSQGGCPRVHEPECSVHKACGSSAGDCCPRADGYMMPCCSESAAEGKNFFESLLV